MLLFMQAKLIDTHCHVHFPAYESDREAVLSRMREKHIVAITIGTAMENSRLGIAFAEAHADVWATVGLHPSHTTDAYQDENEGAVHEKKVSKEQLIELARSSKRVVAIGEAGLDFYRFQDIPDINAVKAIQEKTFREHLLAAYELDLPIVIHCREALPRLAELLQEEQNAGRAPRGVVHSFTGTWEEAKPLLDLGMYLAVNGIATFPLRKNQDPETAIDRTIERIPAERLLVETDAPYLAPSPYRGQRNEPAFVEYVVRHAAEVRGLSFDECAEQTTENAQELFRLV